MHDFKYILMFVFVALAVSCQPAYSMDGDLTYSIDFGMKSHHFGSTQCDFAEKRVRRYGFNKPATTYSVNVKRKCNEINDGIGLTIDNGSFRYSIGRFQHSFYDQSYYVASTIKFKYLNIGVAGFTGYENHQKTIRIPLLMGKILLSPIVEVTTSNDYMTADFIIMPNLIAFRPGIKF